MNVIEKFFLAIDLAWKHPGDDRIKLRIIGSGALLLQTDYTRGTKDGDVLESLELTPEIKERLKSLAGKDTDIHKRTRLYLDIVARGLPFLPNKPKFHPQAALNEKLGRFHVEALDIVDVAVSKLKRFNSDDSGDVAAMIDRGLVPHARLIERFRGAVDRFSLDSRADDLPKIIARLHKIERDLFRVAETPIDLPEWMDR